MAEDLEAPLPQQHLGGTLGLALHEPAGGKVGYGGGELGVKQVLALAGDLQKAVVGPDDLVVLRPEDDHGQGGVDHGVLGGRVHIAGDAFNILDDLFLPVGVAAAEVKVEHQHHRQFRQGGGAAEQGGDARKDQKA